jgi:hypothetical protein
MSARLLFPVIEERRGISSRTEIHIQIHSAFADTYTCHISFLSFSRITFSSYFRTGPQLFSYWWAAVFEDSSQSQGHAKSLCLWTTISSCHIS